MEHNWMYGTSRVLDEYVTGVDEFMKFVVEDITSKSVARTIIA